MKKIKRKKHRGKKQRRLALIVSCVTMVCAALLVSSVWSHDQRRKWQKAAQESSGTSSAPLETENAETPVPVREPAKPTPKPEDPTKQIYTYLQGPKSWNMGLDWSGEWGESFMDGGSFGGFGCGLCCMANIYSTLSRGECSPVDMYRYVKKHTGYGGGMAIDWGYMRRGLTSLGIRCHVEWKQETYRQFRNRIKHSKCAIVLVSSADSTVHWKNTPGHYVTIFEFDSKTDKVFLADSGDPDHNRRWIHLKKIYRSLKTASNWQYLLVKEYDTKNDQWHHKGTSDTWNKPSYLK